MYNGVSMVRLTTPIIFRLRIELLESEPLIWRRLLVPADITLPRLHRCLQIVMGWENYHLHSFEAGQARYGPREAELEDLGMEDERRVRLDALLDDTRRELRYEYDYGDGWEHRIVLEQIETANDRTHYPVCTAGERACPPEDVGGIHGYADFVASLTDRRHDAHEENLRWIGGVFDPAGFDLNAVNRALRRARL
jgi:hypothetical protein